MPTAMPVNPTISQTTNKDTSIVESLCTGFPDLPTDSNGVLATRADGALWDVTSGAYVSIQNSNVGTTACPKNGQ